jgi:hypothetical protein
VGLREARLQAEDAFRRAGHEANPAKKRSRRKVFQELEKLQDAWENLSDEARQLLRDASDINVLDLDDVGLAARLARFYGSDDPGPKALIAHRAAAIALIGYWKSSREVTVTLYAADGSATKPSRTVRWLGYELRRLDPKLTKARSWRVAFTMLQQLAPKRSKGASDRRNARPERQ